jgi:hypothetical protein
MLAKDFLLTCIVVAAIGPFRATAATTHYVDQNSSNPVAPYSDWNHAAINIQDAIDAASAGDTVLVTNGVYQTGGRTFSTGALTNRVVIDQALTVQSVNGPVVTAIQGYRVPDTTNGPGAVRCVYLTNNASLIGFTLTNGATLGTNAGAFDQQGGGIRSGSSVTCVISNCWILGNAASTWGGGAYSGHLDACTLAGNSAAEGGGAYVAKLANCQINSNSAGQGGGTSQAFLSDCTLINNYAPQGGGAFQSFGTGCLVSQNSAQSTGGGLMGGSFTNSILMQNSAQTGGGAYTTTLTNCAVINNQASLMGGGSDLGTLWNCSISQNTALNGGGCYNSSANNCLIVSNQATLGGGSYGGEYTNCTIVGNSAKTSGGGIYAGTGAWAYNSIVIFNTSSSESTFNMTGAKSDYCCTDPFQSYTFIVTNAPRFVDPGAGDFHLQPNSPCINVGNNNFARGLALDGNPRIVSSTVDIGAYEFPKIFHYVSLSNTVPQSPYITWAHAATNIQNAIDASTNGDIVLVANGLYKTGGRAIYGTLTNRAAVNKPITLQSVNGPGVTSIEGSNLGFIAAAPGPVVRCVYLTNGASLIGFTLTNGQAAAVGPADYNIKGGGVYCEDASDIISNCVFIGNNAMISGGAFGGTLFNCQLIANQAYGAGAAASNTLNNCSLIRNGTYFSGLPQYINSQALGSVLNNCTVALNDGPGPALVACTANNSIIYFNTNTLNAQYSNFTNSTLNYCCTTPLPATGANNFTDNPRFTATLARDVHPLATSPCINAGQNASAFGDLDLDGNPRIRGGAVDLGAFEFQSGATEQFPQWLQQHALPADGSADFLDSDNDGFNNLQEWLAGTDPTDATSLLQLATPPQTNASITITWQSVAGRFYFLQRGTNVTRSFSTIQSNLLGQAGTTSYTDTNSVKDKMFFYRVGVQ